MLTISDMSRAKTYRTPPPTRLCVSLACKGRKGKPAWDKHVFE